MTSQPYVSFSHGIIIEYSKSAERREHFVGTGCLSGLEAITGWLFCSEGDFQPTKTRIRGRESLLHRSFGTAMSGKAVKERNRASGAAWTSKLNSTNPPCAKILARAWSFIFLGPGWPQYHPVYGIGTGDKASCANEQFNRGRDFRSAASGASRVFVGSYPSGVQS